MYSRLGRHVLSRERHILNVVVVRSANIPETIVAQKQPLGMSISQSYVRYISLNNTMIIRPDMNELLNDIYIDLFSLRQDMIM